MNLRYVFAHAWFTGIKAIRTNYLYIVANLTFPLSLLFIVGFLSNGSLLPYALVGGLIAVLASNGLSMAGELAIFKLHDMHQDLIVATVTSPIDYMLGATFSNLFWSIPSITLYIILDLIYHLLTPYSFLITIIIAVFLIISMSSIAFICASLVGYLRNIWAISGILSMLLIVMSPTFFPYTYLPKPILFVLSILPTTPAAVLEQGVVGISPMLWYMAPILIMESIAYFAIAKYLTRWQGK